jgi:ferredoxin
MALMESSEQRTIGGLVVRIDRLLCVGFGDCLDEAVGGLELDDEGIATFTAAADGLARERVLAACRACPVDAITVFDCDHQIAP